MDKAHFETKLLMTYRDFISLNREQLQLATMERYDNQIIDVQDFEEKKLEYQTMIQNMLDEISGYSSLSESTREQLINDVIELQQLNQQLQHIFNFWYSEDSRSMKQVRVQRTTLQVYGGVNNADFVSYYIDDKK